MILSLLRRFAQTLLVLFGVSAATFLAMHAAPGHPLQANPELRLDPTAVERWLQLRQLDQPLLSQYLSWLSRVFRGDFGDSLLYNRPVVELIAERLPSTLLLTVTAFCLALFLAIVIGIYAATRQNSWLDRFVCTLSLAGISVPNFWFGIVLIILFAYRFPLLPSVGLRTPGDGSLLDILRHMLMPLFVMVAGNFAHYVRYVRSAILDVLNQDYIRAVRSRGLQEKEILYRHVLPNAAIPIITIAALSLPRLFTGAMVAEYVFGWPGIGRWIITSTMARDYPVIMTVNLYTASLVAMANFLADALYLLIDPRTR
ncbi:MAG TPA: ABC transporter permease [Oscillospiraceae bacterium]|nr:ABC transporter permease [Oscillospiraceae bacterium]